MKINKKLLVTFSIIGLIPMAVVLQSFVLSSSMEEGYEMPAQWKNLKVLPQDISKDSLEFLMVGYSNALGVNCGHCHSPQKDNPGRLDFAADGKIEKEIARGMIHMTNDLNEKYFKPHFPEPIPDQVFVVNCVMCHRGTPNPELYLSKMGSMYKTYDPEKDHRKEIILEQMKQKEGK